MPFYDDLLNATETDQRYLLSAPIIEDVFEGRFSLSTYLAFLNQAYHHVRHTAPLLELAKNNLQPNQHRLKPVFEEYIAEETGHEKWILEDIAACGVDAAPYENGPAPYQTELMVSYLYDYVSRKNPLGIFGMVLVLEGTSSSLAPAVADIVKAQLSLPETALTYLVSHGELDQGHIAFFEQTMNSITDPRDQQDIIHVAQRVYRLYGDVYREIPIEADRLLAAA